MFFLDCLVHKYMIPTLTCNEMTEIHKASEMFPLFFLITCLSANLEQDRAVLPNTIERQES